ncbi:hypothetical protein V8F20_008591 [Naviculisporaceae sp. PSN 640]
MASSQVDSCQTPDLLSDTKPSNGHRTKTLRLTENKRRYRARRKEYVSDLESRLAAAREQGVQASKEVQLAAQQVAIRNARLRDLLSLAGFDAFEIESWESDPSGIGCSSDRADDGMVSPCARRRRLISAIEEKARRCAAVIASYGPSEEPDAKGELATPLSSSSPCEGPLLDSALPVHMGCGRESSSSKSDRLPVALGTATAQISTPPINLTTVAPDDERPPKATGKSSCGTSTCGTRNSGKEIPVPVLPTCKLLSRLAENPAADITQVHVPEHNTTTGTLNSNEEQPCQDDKAGASHGGNIECKKAYDMLIQYATTEEKMDTIARALESGCTKNKNGKGGCAVRSEVILQALDTVSGL